MPTYDYFCKAGHVHEAREGYDVRTRPCPACGATAERSAVNLVIPFTETGAKMSRLSPVPFDQRRVKLSKFVEASQELDYHHKKAEEKYQRKLDNPSYFREGVKRAKEVLAGQRPPPKEF